MLLAGVSEDEERAGYRATQRLTLSILRREGYGSKWITWVFCPFCLFPDRVKSFLSC